MLIVSLNTAKSNSSLQKNFHPPIPGRVELHSVESEITAAPPPDAGSAKIPAGSFAGAGPGG